MQTRHSRASSSSSSLKQRRSGYEPSDTETEWQDSPWHEINQKNGRLVSNGSRIASTTPRNASPLKSGRRNSFSMVEYTESEPSRRQSKSPYKTRKEDGHRHVSPFKEFGSGEKHSHHHGQVRRVSEISSRIRVLSSNTRPRWREKDSKASYGSSDRRSPSSKNPTRKEREASPLQATPSVVEINEMVANAKLSKSPVGHSMKLQGSESLSPGGHFTHHDRKMPNLVKERGIETHQGMMANDSYVTINNNKQRNLSGRTTTSDSAVNRQSSGKNSNGNSKRSDAGGRISESNKKFTEKQRTVKTEVAWYACIKKGSCRKSKSPKIDKNRAFNEASFIEKASVVEELGQFWADKHRPTSLNGFTCHKQEAQFLKQLVSRETCPHILFKGPPGSGKTALVMGLIGEIFGDEAEKKSHDLKYFHVKEKRSMQVLVPITSSAHHVELNVNSEPNAKYALVALVKKISASFTHTPEVSHANFKENYKVIVLYEVDKAAESIQHLIKWVIDCYSDTCRLMLCCEDDKDIIESVQNRCKLIKVDAPVTHEIMEVLIQIARKEDFDLPMSFAAKIATKSKQNMRRAIMALEACKENNYPFHDDKPIPFGWEEVLVELSSEILADPSPKRLFFVRGKLQKLLVDHVHPKLVLQKLVEEFLKRVEASLKRELYYWHAYYVKRLPPGTSALLKLEEFVAKFMSLYRKSFSNLQRQFA